MATYTRVEATGTVQQINPQGVKVDGFWWNPSKHVAVDLSRFKLGDTVFVEGDETHDGARRWISSIDFAEGFQRAAATVPDGPVYDVDPDDLPESRQRPTGSRPPASLRDDRLACLQVAAGILMPSWVKKGVEPDHALLTGFAEALVDYLHQPRQPRA